MPSYRLVAAVGPEKEEQGQRLTPLAKWPPDWFLVRKPLYESHLTR